MRRQQQQRALRCDMPTGQQPNPFPVGENSCWSQNSPGSGRTGTPCAPYRTPPQAAAPSPPRCPAIPLATCTDSSVRMGDGSWGQMPQLAVNSLLPRPQGQWQPPEAHLSCTASPPDRSARNSGSGPPSDSPKFIREKRMTPHSAECRSQRCQGLGALPMVLPHRCSSRPPLSCPHSLGSQGCLSSAH